MSKSKHSKDLCRVRGCKSKAAIYVYPCNTAYENEPGAIFSQKWQRWYKAQATFYNAYCKQHWSEKLAPIVKRGEHMFTYMIIQ